MTKESAGNKEVKVVVGANYGDEGKGLASAYFAREAEKAGRRCLTVLYNGGPQRGHTVESKGLERHVYHSLGSGTEFGSETFLDQDFMIEPVALVSEMKKFKKAKVWIHADCRIITPFDILAGQERERRNNHGSCGSGIFATKQRYDGYGGGDFPNLLSYRLWSDESFLYQYLAFVEDWYKHLYPTSHIVLPTGYDMIFVDAMKYVINHAVIVSSGSIAARDFDTIIFEGGQGLGLSGDNYKEYPHLTPSLTGCKIPIKRIKEWNSNKFMEWDTELVYVTRTYLTRHGNGLLENGSSDFWFSNNLEEDSTNVSNEWQGTIRGAAFTSKSFSDMLDRVQKDSGNTSLRPHFFVTHCNEMGGSIINNLAHYVSFSRYVEDVYSQPVEDMEISA